MLSARAFSCEQRPRIHADDSFRNTYPVLAAADNKMLRFVIIAVLALHAAMALAMKVLFFSQVLHTNIRLG